jgi:hypothetical protein
VFYVLPGYLPGYYGWDYPAAPPPDTSPVAEARGPEPEANDATGILRLEVEPAPILQLYVDGYFVGAAEDFANGVELAAGTHTVELHAPGYQMIHLDVRMSAGRAITYRGALQPAGVTVAPVAPAPVATAADPVASVAPAPPQTIYHIPGCYLGNIPPKDAKLPGTCDQSRVTTIKP